MDSTIDRILMIVIGKPMGLDGQIIIKIKMNNIYKQYNNLILPFITNPQPYLSIYYLFFSLFFIFFSNFCSFCI